MRHLVYGGVLALSLVSGTAWASDAQEALVEAAAYRIQDDCPCDEEIADTEKCLKKGLKKAKKAFKSAIGYLDFTPSEFVAGVQSFSDEYLDYCYTEEDPGDEEPEE